METMSTVTVNNKLECDFQRWSTLRDERKPSQTSLARCQAMPLRCCRRESFTSNPETSHEAELSNSSGHVSNSPHPAYDACSFRLRISSSCSEVKLPEPQNSYEKEYSLHCIEEETEAREVK